MLEIIVLSLIFIVSLVILVRNLDLGIKVLLVLSVFLHKEVFSIYRWDFLPVRFFMLALTGYAGTRFILWFIKTRDVKKVIEFCRDPFVILFSSIWLVRGISIIFSKNLQASILLFGFFTTVVVLGFLLYFHLKNDSEKILNLIKLYIYIAFGLTLFGYFQLWLYLKHDFIIGALWNVPGHIPRIGSTFWDVNHFAALLASLLPVLGVFILTSKSIKTKIAYTAIFLTMTSMLFLTSSRTSWIIAFVSFVLFSTVLLIRKLGRKGLAIIVGITLLVTIPLLVEYSDKASPFRKAVKDNFHYRIDSFASHLMLLTGSYQIFEEKPILGGGYGSFFEHFKSTDIAATFYSRDPAALNTRVPPHTIWGEAMAETGVLGLSLFILFVLMVASVMLYGVFHLKDSKKVLMLTAMFSTFIGILTAGIFYSYNSEFFWLILFLYFFYAVSIVFQKHTYQDIIAYFIREKKFYLFVVVVVSVFMIFSGLGKNHLIPWDEAIYAKIAKNMVQQGEYLNLFWQRNKIWYEKPPFYMWEMAFFMKFMGFGSIAARLPSAIAGFLTVLLTFLMSKKYFGKLAAYFSALSLVLGVHYLYYTRAAMIDVTTTFFLTLAIFIYFKTLEHNKKYLWIMVGLVIGLAVMTKGVIGLLPLVIIGVHELIKKPSFRNPGYYLMMVGILAVALPWHLIMYLRYGFAFIDQYFIYHVFNRATQAIEDKGQPFFWYVTVMKVSMRIWFIPLMVGFPLFLVKSFKHESKYLVFTIWFVVTFLLFSSASSKIAWYIVPIYPAAAVMVGYIVSCVFKRIQKTLGQSKNYALEFFYVFLVTGFALTYFFYYRDMVYTDDLTKDKAKLLIYKDEKYDEEELLYINSIELPIILYYTDGPFLGFDLNLEKGRMPVQSYDKRVNFLTKKGRFSDSSEYYGKPPHVIKEMGDYIMWYYESDLEIDKDRLKDVVNAITNLSKEPFINYDQLVRLKEERTVINSRLSPFMQNK